MVATRRACGTNLSTSYPSSSSALPPLTAAQQKALDFPQRGRPLAPRTRVFACRLFHGSKIFDAAVVTGTAPDGRYVVRFVGDGQVKSVPFDGLVLLSDVKKGLEAFVADSGYDDEGAGDDTAVNLIDVPDGENVEEWNQCVFKCAGLGGDVKLTVPWSQIYFGHSKLRDFTIKHTRMPDTTSSCPAPRVRKRAHIPQDSVQHAEPEFLLQNAVHQMHPAHSAQAAAQSAQPQQIAAQQIELPQPLSPDDPAGTLAAAIVAKVELENDDDVIILDDVPAAPKSRRLMHSVPLTALPPIPAAAAQIVFGNAIHDPDDDAVVSYQSPFFAGKVFKFREVQRFVADDGSIRRHYKCVGCAEVADNPRYNGPLPVLVYTENGKFIGRDPDAPLESKHLCMLPKPHHGTPSRPKLEPVAANDAM
ncbi:hypothetical protein AAVH_31914 [Aphelenchoides avenae]|nr:hypothetical protein AAVH_31914 [Aphelenchus avenae]